MAVVALLAGCGKNETADKPAEDANWAPEMVNETDAHAGHDHGSHEGHDHDSHEGHNH